MAGKLTASFILKLEDQLSGPLAKIEKQLAGLAALGKKLNLGGLEAGNRLLDEGAAAARRMASGLGSIEKGAMRAASALGHMASQAGRAIKQAADRIGIIGGAGAGISVMEPIRAYAERDKDLRQIAITQGKTGSAVPPEISRLNKLFNRDAMETGQSSGSITDAYKELVQMGIPANLVDEVINKHSKAATAYDISAKDLGPAVSAMLKSFQIGPDDIGGALAAMAAASKQGRFKITDFSRELPGIAGMMGSMGMHGRGAADTTFAAMETVMNNASNPGQAAADITEALSHVISRAGIHNFKREGIDLIGILEAGKAKGMDPIATILDLLKTKTKGLDEIKAASVVKSFFPDQQSGYFFTALLQHNKEFEELRKNLHGITEETLNEDFKTMFESPEVQLRLFSEGIEQLNRRIGQGFAPAIKVANWVIDQLLSRMEAMDKRWPGLADKVLAGVAAFLVLVAALGALSVALPAIEAGLGLLFGPIGAIIVVAGILAEAAGYIVDNWSELQPFFQEMWDGVKQVFRGAYQFVAGWVTGDWQRALNGIEEVWSGVKDWFAGEFKVFRDLFTQLGKWVDAWTSDGWSKALGGITTEFDQVENKLKNSWLGRQMGWSVVPVPGVGHEDGDGNIAERPYIPQAANTTMTIELAPELRVRQAPPSVPGMDFNVKPLNPFGQVLGRP